jgi:hypothetical protein
MLMLVAEILDCATGSLGIGQRCHPLPWKVLTYDTKLGGYVIDLNKDTLRNAPSYAMDEAPT